mmetsp:Transcript_21284/g.30122  ORF Transcript_21284/g.30122 Transcript_21284/m.30122 type:complete len:1342 (-) Transcript_21284:135-4160(-)
MDQGDDDDTKTYDFSKALPGRVVRLNFCVYAELPLGSTLRVTGSTLWAPTDLTAQDPTNAHHVAAQNATQGPAVGSLEVVDPHVLESSGYTSLYASSVELVTTPEEYPLWKTKRPVVVVMHKKSSSQIQHHYYRYMIVTPGAHSAGSDSQQNLADMPFSSNTDLSVKSKDGTGTTGGTASGSTGKLSALSINSLANNNNNNNNNNNMMMMTGTTSDGMEGSIPVMMWEDPFPHLGMPQKSSQAFLSSTSLPSLNTNTKDKVAQKTLTNLPYRTLDIEVGTGQVMRNPSSSDIPQGYSVFDKWNNGDDFTYRPYLIRESINGQNYKLNRGMSDVSETSEPQASSPTTGGGLVTAAEGMVVDDHDNEEEEDGDQVMTTSGISSIAASSGALTPTTPSQQSMQRIFFVCYHLPVVVTKNAESGEWTARWAESLLAKTEGSAVVKGYDANWVGTVTTNPPIASQEDQDAVTRLLESMSCIPLFIDDETRKNHYYGFCKQVLWPAFHNIDMLDLSTSGWIFDKNNNDEDGENTTINSNNNNNENVGTTNGNNNNNNNNNNNKNSTAPPIKMESDWDQSRLDNWLQSFTAVNKKFAQVMGDVLKPNDTLWVHDYHLSLLPKLVHDDEIKFGKPVSKKIFFLHIPFPTSQMFREIEFGEVILEGMLHADVVGFHSFDHARHFLNAAKRILGLNYESLVGGLIGVLFHGRTVLVTMSNVSIEPKMLDQSLQLPTVESTCTMLQQKHHGRMIISGLDIAQRLSGVNLKLIAFERLLTDYPSWQKRVVMVQKVLLPGSRKADETNTIRELRASVKRIRDAFGPDVLDYEEVFGSSSLPVDQRLGLWKASDIFMVTPIREGLNMLPMEYIYARKEPHPPGVVIASEFSAVTSILNGALRVNPYDIQMSTSTIDKALSMSLQEREGRRYRDIDFVSTSPSDQWTRNVLRDLRDVTHEKSGRDSESQSAASTPNSGKNGRPKQLIDTTAAFLASEREASFTRLNHDVVKRAYDMTTNRVIVLDFNGTIVLKEPPGKYLKREILGSSGYKPPASVIQALTTLCLDPRNTIYVVSGDASETVQKALGHIGGLGLAASNGGHFSTPFDPRQGGRQWRSFDLGVDWDAVKRVALPVLSKYTARSNGSFVKLTHFSIGWSYYSCDPEWGSLQASHLVLELENELRAFDVRFVTLKGVVEIVPRKLNKGLIVKKVLRDVAAKNGGIDFILCMGDDISDEKMFTSVFSYIAEVGDDDEDIVPSPPVIGEGSNSHGGGDDAQMEDVSTGFGNQHITTGSGGTELRDPFYAFTTAVGRKHSHASQYVNDAEEVAHLLVRLSGENIPDGGVAEQERSSNFEQFT